jgi:hypothetical protein
VADKLTIIEERILREDANGASTQLLTLEAQWAPKFTPLAEIVKRIGAKTRLLRNGRSSRVALLIPERTRLMDDGTPVASFTLHRPGGRSWITADELAESHWDDCEREAFEQAWQVEADDLATNLTPSASTSRPVACCRSGTCWATRRRSAALSPRMAGHCSAASCPPRRSTCCSTSWASAIASRSRPINWWRRRWPVRWCPSMPCPAPASSVRVSMARRA